MSADTLVLDASALVEVLLGTEVGDEISSLIRTSAGLVGPAHVDAEVLSALARLTRAGAVPEHVVDDSLGDLADIPMRRLAIAPLLADAWALRSNVAVRDALYVIAAARLGALLVTTDGPLARAVERHGWCAVRRPG